MPIRFEQPSPVSAGASGGAANVLLRQQAMAQQQQLAMAELYQRSAIAAQQAGVGYDANARQHDANIRSLESREGMQAYGATQARLQQQAEIEGRLMINRDQLSQAEMLRLQRMRSAVSEVQSADWLTKEQQRDYSLELMTGINELEKRNAAASVKLKEQAYNQAIEKARVQAGVQQEIATYKARGLGDRLHTQTIQGLGPVTFYEKAPGQFEVVQPPKTEKPHTISPVDIRKQAETAAEKMFPMKDLVTAEDAAKVRDERRAYIAQYEQELAQAYRASGMQIGGEQPAAGGMAGVAGGGQQTPTTEVGKSFNINDPKGSGANERQVLLMDTFGDTKRLVVESNLPPQAKDMYQEQAAVAESLLAQYGNVGAMGQKDPKLASLFNSILVSLARVQRQLSGPPPSPAPAQSSGPSINAVPPDFPGIPLG